jgi:hypothetical protein
MAYGVNPLYGIVPGAPYGLHGWNGNQFQLFGNLPPLPPAAEPPPPLAATPTMQDAAVRPAAVALTGAGGAEPGGGGPGGGPGGIGPGTYPGQPNPGMGGGVYAPGGDQTFSGFPGVYAQAPGELNSQFGSAGGTLGALGGSIGGIPGPGTVLGFGGGALDAARYNAINAQYGVPGHINPWLAGATSVLEGIGVPFTNWNLANLFDVPSTRARQLGLVDDAGYIGREAMGYGALAANAPHTPGAPFGNTGWNASMNPTMGQYPPGFFENEAKLAAQAAIDPGVKAGVDIATGKGIDPGIDTAKGASGQGAVDVSASSSRGTDKGGGSDQGSGDTSKSGQDKGGDVSGTSGVADGSGYKFRGGLIGRPPGQAGDDITRDQFGMLRGIDPPGPDDQIAAVQSGEGVLTRKALARYPGLLAAANAGTLDPAKVKGLLGAMPARRAR